MGKVLEKPDESLYERDFYAWLQDQAAKLRARQAINETGLSAKTFPTEPPFSVTEALNDRFWPGETFQVWDVLRD